MHRTRKLLMVSSACVGIVILLLLTALLTVRLLANRDMVKSFVAAKAAQATGGTLDYNHLEIKFFPLPHLSVRAVHLRRPDAFDVTAQELSVYPRIRPLLRGRVRIRRLALAAPDINIPMGSNPLKAPDSPADKRGRSFKDDLGKVIRNLFGALGAIDPKMDLEVADGVVTLAFVDAPDLRIGDIDISVGNDDGELTMKLKCRSDLTGKLDASARADIDAMQADGQVNLTDMQVGPFLRHATLPGGITAKDTRAAVKAAFTVDGPETVTGQFDIQFPSLTVMRGGLKLDLDTVALSGVVDYAGNSLSVSIDTLQSAQPALDLSAAASLKPTGDAGKSVFQVQAATGELDVAVAGALARAIAGDLDGIRTAFSVAKKGLLKDASYFARFDVDESGWHLNQMKAAGRLSRGLVTIPGIDADLERMDGRVIFENRHVEFKNVSGHFKGATFQELDAAIDWEKQSTLMIACPSVVVDVATMNNWLTGFKGLAGQKKYVESISGDATLSHLKISGPLTRPAEWLFNISGTPQAIRFNSPLVPFETSISGGEITYIPGKERAKDVGIEFLDGSLAVSFQSKGIVNPESVAFQIDGSMGQATIDWLGTILPIPKHLQIKPPVDLSGVNIAWERTRNTLSFAGRMKSAGGVALFTDFTRTPDSWQIHKLQFSDGHLKATASLRIKDHTIELAFSGNVERQTADRLLRDNRTLSGRLEGDFRSMIDSAAPLNSSFNGQLSGEGLHLQSIVRDPIAVKHFSIDGRDNQLRIAPTEISLLNSHMVVDGTINRSDNGLIFDLNVNADRLDEALIRTLQPVDDDKADTSEKAVVASAITPRGTVHVKADEFTYGGYTWSPVQADVHLDGDTTQVQIDQADLCGISTTGQLAFSPEGMSMHVTPTARNNSIQETARCLADRPLKAVAQYDLTADISLPPTRENPVRFLSGQMEFSSENGKIEYADVLMKIFSILNITEWFTGGKSNLTEKGFNYKKAYAKAEMGGGILRFSEILLDGNALKVTGQGEIHLETRETDIRLLAAPLKTIDRMVDKIPGVNYIVGGSLISIPLRMTGPLNNIKVRPMSGSAVGDGLINIMKRTLKSPFKLVQDTSEYAVEESSKVTPSWTDSPADGR
jgi:hypothetical protein